MLKKMTYRKLTVSFCALFALLCIYFFPLKDNTLELKTNIIYEEDKDYEYIYLIDNKEYVSLVSLQINSKSIEDKIKERIEYLIIDSDYENVIPKGFKGVIPKNTKINSVKVEDNKVYIDFSEEILNIEEDKQEKMLETIIFTSTENNLIEEVYLFINGNEIEEINSKKIKYPLTRKYGINKKYDITKLDNLSKTTVYYVGDIDDRKYYVPITYVSNDTTEKIMVIINELKSSIIYQSNLSSYLNNSTKLNNYEIIENTMYLDFNEKIFDIDNEIILEEVKYTISESVFENYEVKEVVFKVNGEEVYKVS